MLPSIIRNVNYVVKRTVSHILLAEANPIAPNNLTKTPGNIVFCLFIFWFDKNSIGHIEFD